MADDKMNFTKEQESAIYASGGSVVVSAAAGSGKTRVLVQRVIEMLLKEENPVYADRLLIVTFTKAAAAEMKQRILKEVEKLLKADPENMHLRRQQVLLPNADICTVHSFCSRIVRENFSALDISQDFRIAEDTELSVIKYRLMSDIIEKKYGENTQAFRLLSTILSSPKNDTQLEKSLLEVYRKVSAHPDMEGWLQKAAAMYHPSVPLKETIFAEIALQRLQVSIRYFEEILETADKIVYENPKAFCKDTATSAEKKLNSQQAFVLRLRELAEKKDWNGISKAVVGYEKQKYLAPRGKEVLVSKEELQTLKIGFGNIDNEIEKQLKPIFGITEEVYQSDTQQIYPAVCCMCEIVREFAESFLEKKKEKGILDFSDLEHLTLELLRGEKENEKSALAEMISQKYDAVMVDEFQDTNEIQDKIFRYVSRNEENMFVVGDVKQSIYRFREAMPEIFKSRIRNSADYQEGGEFPACIRLDKNFRSRQEVVDSVNFVFHTIMSEYMGDIAYDEKETMKAGAVYPEKSDSSYETEIHVLNGYPESEEEKDNRTEYEKEAVYIAKIIRQMIKNGFQVSDNGKLRTARYSDFCILMRYVSSHANDYSDMINQYGVPTYVSQPYSLLECYETNRVLSLLKAVDNRQQDIPMLAVMLCPVFGFTPDDLAFLKVSYHAEHLYSKVFSCSGIENEEETPNTEIPDGLQEKCRQFIVLLDDLRKLSVTLSVSELTEVFFEKTGYTAVISAMPNGDIRVKNLRKLMSFIRDYESGAKGNLSEFVRYISYLEKNGTEISADDTAPENSVKIMSIHHSKGLEYPVCILAGMNMKGDSVPPDIYCHKTLGFGMKMTDSATLCKYDTLQRNIIRQSAEHEELSEAMRVLYVAMTRAREKLIAVVTLGGRKTSKKSSKTPKKPSDPLSEKLKEIASYVKITDGRIEPHCVENAETFGNWILMCALTHPSMKALREKADAEDIIPLPTVSEWKYVESRPGSEKTGETVQQEEQAEPDGELLRLLEERFKETYRHESRVTIPAKVSASLLVHQEASDSYIAKTRPSFMQESSLTGAEKGTAMHTFLQYADFGNLGERIREEKKRLLEAGKLSQEQYDNIPEEDVKAFTHSETYKSMIQAEKIYREYQFTVNISAKDVDESYDAEEKVILQGAMDCLVYDSDGLTIIDYKTDHVHSLSELKRRYARQLALYKNAAEQIFEKPVKKCLIYSIRLGQEIEI